MVNLNNWAYTKADSTVTEKDIVALAKAKKQDEKKEKNGHKWFVINNRTKLLVECNANGQPTKRGLRQIETAKKSFL